MNQHTASSSQSAAPAPGQPHRPSQHKGQGSSALKELTDQAYERLCAKYPILTQNKPLKVGIDWDVRQQNLDLSIKVIKRAISRIVSQNAYLEALVPGADRYDLDGNPVGKVVVETQAKIAAERLNRYKNPKQRLGLSMRGVVEKNVTPTTKEVFGDVQARHPKVSVGIDLGSVLDMHTIGMSGVWLKLQLPCGSEVAARINAKSFRKAVETYRLHNGEVHTFISGELHLAESEIKGAGLVVSIKQPKPAAEPAASV